MKKLSYFAALFMTVIMSACSNIEENDRMTYVEPAKAERNVLIEDFTGQKCVNCPFATDAIHEMQQTYGEEHVIAVAIHSGSFGVAAPKGLMNELGQEYWNHWFTSEGQPIGKVNRGASDNDYTNWAKTVASELAKPSDVSLDVKTEYNESTRQLTISTQTLGKANTTGKYQLWITEDSIVAVQLHKDKGTIKDYVHNHVLRDAINGSWGEDITLGESAKTLTHTYTIPETYKAENCAIVAFIYNDSGVLQVVRKKI